MREIMLIGGQIAYVDDIDYGFLTNISPKWGLSTNKKYISCKKQNIKMHKVIAERMGLDISRITDHKDRNVFNNLRENFREATNSESGMNREIHITNKLGEKNIYWSNRFQKYIVQIWVKKKRAFHKYCDTLEEAIRIRDIELPKHHGEFTSFE